MIAYFGQFHRKVRWLFGRFDSPLVIPIRYCGTVEVAVKSLSCSIHRHVGMLTVQKSKVLLAKARMRELVWR